MVVRIVMVYFGLFVKLQTYAVSTQIAYNAEAVLAGMSFDSLADFAHKPPRACGFLADFKTFASDAHKLFLFGRSLANDKHA